MRPLAEEYFEWDPDAQNARFARKFVPHEMQIITLGRHDVGWLQLQEAADEIVLGQLFVAPAFQGRGIGTKVVSDLLANAQAKNKSVTLEVLKNNRAREFYERLGFSNRGESGIKYIMRWDGTESS